MSIPFHWKEEGTEVYKFEMEWEFVHNLAELYKRMHFWLEENNWEDFYGDDSFETLFWQRDHPGGMSEHHIWWRAMKNPGQTQAQQKQFQYFFKINFQTIAVSKTEVMHKGKKWKLYKSDTIIRFEAYVRNLYEIDAKKNLGKWLESFREYFSRSLYKETRKQALADCYNQAREFQNMIKSYVEISKLKEEEPNLYPPNTLP